MLDTLLPELRISHKALVLAYEQATTGRATNDRWWDCSAHLLGISERTRQSGNAHFELARCIGNPVTVKLVQAARSEDVTERG